MAEVPPFFKDFQPDEDDFNISELLSKLVLEEVPVNQSSRLQNPGPDSSLQSQNMQQTTMGGLDGTSSSWINQNGPNWPQTASSGQQWPNQLAMSNQVPGMQPPMNQCSQQFPCQFNEVPITPYSYDPQSSTMRHQNSFIHQPQLENFYMTLNTKISQHGGFNQPGPSLPAPRIQYFPNQGQVDQASVSPNMENMQQENLVPRNIGKSTRSQMENLQVHVLQNQNARPNVSDAGPDSSLQSQQMEGVPPSFMEDYVNQLGGVPSLPLEEVPVNHSSMLCIDQAGQNMLVDNNDSTRQTTQFPPHNHQVSGDHDLLNSNCYDSTFFEPTSSSRQPQQGHVNMTPNTPTSQHGGFNQPRPSLPAPRIQCIPNQGQVDQASVIPNIVNMQQENLVPRNFGKSTRSQMDSLQVRGLQNRVARPNASNSGLDNSLQSQNRGLNTQQVQRAESRDPFWNYVEYMANGSMKCSFCPHKYAINTSISRIKLHLSGKERRGVAICRKVTKDVQDAALKAIYESKKRHKTTTSSINVNDRGISTCPQEQNIENENMGGDIGRVLREDQVDRVDDALKECLLYCALFPEDDMIERGKLIGYLIDEGIIKGMRRRQDAFDKGHKMLDRLEYFSLLESAENEDDLKCVMMHDLIRDMAIQILQENSQVIVEAGAQLEELPDAEEWTENLTRVSLMKNQIKEIPSSYSPMCPNLSTLLLCENRGLVSIADSFFKQLRGLKVLDLSYTEIEILPDSVSDLVSLTALLLIDCGRLRYVPSLEKLRALKSLDLYRTSLEKMPQGMECLSNLRYFRITGCGEKEFPSGILPKLSHLQVFVLGEFRTECYTFEGMEVGCLGKLETLECHFKGFSDFVKYLTSRDGIHSLSTYKISVGTLEGDYWDEFEDILNKTVRLGNLSVNKDRDFQVKFLNGIQGLYCESIDARSLCDVLSLENATELEFIRIKDCDSMESLVSSSWFCSAILPLPSHNGMFSRLKEFHCVECNSMEKLFPLELLSYLVNLEEIYVGFCDRMEEIIGTTDEESSTSNPITELTLPKLKNLYLINLDELKRICSAKLICNSLKEIEVIYCEKLKRMAISLPLLENGQPSPHPSLERITVYPQEWWETVVEWEPPNTKEVLRPIVKNWLS